MPTTQNIPGLTRADHADGPADDRQMFELYGRRITSTASSDVQQLLAAAHTDRVRPLCLCRPNGVAMYVAKIGTDRYVIKRMPDTGPAHAARCASYLPPEELSGLGQVLGSAITEEADSGLTAIKLGFRMSKAERAAPAGASGGEIADSVSASPNRLTLRAVLHYLWQEADLATSSPGMASKRNWRVVSWYLRQAARDQYTKGRPLATLLYIPEPFTAEKKTEIDTAEEKIGEAVAQLDKIDAIKKTAGSIQKGAAKIESECTSITTSIRRLLDQALVSLAGHGASPSEAGSGAIDGAA